ncbi:MAG: tetratricopeptide repeat protein [Candidatus Aureabacteria bacterium]|nr:tetratricopeptide repeat protein [Candidatus Auribacterota bacterium]
MKISGHQFRGQGAGISVLIFLAVFLSYAYFIHFIGREEWNATSRFDLTFALVEEGTFRIDSYHGNTGDKVFFRGHYYSDKAPGPSFLAVPFYWSLLKLGVEEERTIQYLLTLIIIGLPSALSSLVLYRLLGEAGGADEEGKVTLTLAYALGTLIAPFSTVFYGHALAAAAALVSFFLLFRMRAGIYPERWSTAWLAGFVCAWGFLCDFPAGIAIAGLTLYALFALRRKRLVIAWLLGILLPVGILGYYNHACFGSPIASSYSYHQVYDHHAGLLGITIPKLAALWGITFSPYRGIFYQSPFLLLVFPAFVYYARRKNRWEWFLCLFMAAGFFFFNSGYAYWDGVGSIGARFLIPALPFLLLPLAALPKNWRGPLKVLVFISIVFMLVVNATEPRAEWKVSSPLFFFSFFLLSQGYLSDNLGTLAGLPPLTSLLPLLIVLALFAFVLRKLIPRPERVSWSGFQTKSALGVAGLVLLWIGIAGWEEPYLREFDKAESLFRYFRGRGEVDWPAVEDRYRQALEFEPRFMDPYLRLAEIARFRGMPRAALAYYDEMLSLDPRSTAIRLEKAVVFEAIGEETKAEAILEEAREIAPRDVSIRLQLAEFYGRRGRAAEAIGELEEALKLQPGDARIRMRLEEEKERANPKSEARNPRQIQNSKSE